MLDSKGLKFLKRRGQKKKETGRPHFIIFVSLEFFLALVFNISFQADLFFSHGNAYDWKSFRVMKIAIPIPNEKGNHLELS